VPLPDARPVPPEFSPRRTRALMYNEGATWAWHWGVINNILLFSMCAKGSGGQQSFLVPEGWEPVGPGTGQLPGIYDLVQTDGSPPMPFMALLKTTNSSEGQLAIVFRGTNSGPEWMLGGWPAPRGGCGEGQGGRNEAAVGRYDRCVATQAGAPSCSPPCLSPLPPSLPAPQTSSTTASRAPCSRAPTSRATTLTARPTVRPTVKPEPGP
jgi:hypothetical protein